MLGQSKKCSENGKGWQGNRRHRCQAGTGRAVDTNPRRTPKIMSISTLFRGRAPEPAKTITKPRRAPWSFLFVPQIRLDSQRGVECSVVSLPEVIRLMLTIAPQERGSFHEQMNEVLTVMESVMARRPPLTFTMLTIFVREAADRARCERAFAEFFGEETPVINIVVQPPCCGAALAVESWAIGGGGVSVERFSPQCVSVTHDGIRWIYCGGIKADNSSSAYGQTFDALAGAQGMLEHAGSSFDKVVRTWLYLGDRTCAAALRDPPVDRARFDFYRDSRSQRGQPAPLGYPANTLIGTEDENTVMSCLAVETERQDVFLTPLDDPQQTCRNDFPANEAFERPKVSGAMALVAHDYVTVWISGTGGSLDSEGRSIIGIESQTEQAINNIERLVSQENFRRHGITGTGVGLRDLTRIRVYLRRAEDLARCRTICERRFGRVPALYITAHMGRPESLVEIEGVAFSRCAG